MTLEICFSYVLFGLMPHHCLCAQAWGRAEDQASLLSVYVLLVLQCFHVCTLDLLLTHSAFLFDSSLFPAPRTQKCDPGQILLFRLKQQEDRHFVAF